MFLRNTTKSGRSNGAVGLFWGGIAFIAVGVLLVSLASIGVELTSRIAFAAVALPVVGVVCLISALTAHIRSGKRQDAPAETPPAVTVPK